MYYQIYRMESGHKIIVGFASHPTQAALIMEAEREKSDDELQIGMEEVKEDQDGISD